MRGGRGLGRFFGVQVQSLDGGIRHCGSRQSCSSRNIGVTLVSCAGRLSALLAIWMTRTECVDQEGG